MSSLQAYQSSLRRANGDIRLLTLRSGTWGSPVQCLLNIASLNDNPSYCAVSYTWGDPGVTSSILINQTNVLVTKNLERALRHLRDEQSDLILWVDAVCINQQNTEERNEQVGIMGRIYTAASTVLVWIGEADDLSDRAFDSLDDVASGLADQETRSKVSSFYLNLVNRQWFNRVWVIQELALAVQDPVVCCGRKCTKWSLFMSAWTTLSTQLYTEIGMVRTKSSDVGEEGSQGVELLAQTRIDVLNSIRNLVGNRKDNKFQRLYMYSRMSEATNPRDRVYGLLGMLAETDRARFSIDYERPVPAVFADATKHIFEKGEGPLFLSGMWLHSGETSFPGLPTWALDFDGQTAEKAMHPGSISFHPPSPRSASGVGAGAQNGEVCNDGKTLKIEVLPVDVVKETIEFEPTLDGCIHQLRMVEGLVTRARSIEIPEDSLEPYYKNFRTSEPLWCILVSGKKHMSGYDSAPESYGQAYAELVESEGASYDQRTQDPQVEDSVLDEYRQSLRNHLPGRTLFMTNKGLIGVGYRGIRIGDHVTIWFGAITPFVTRPCTPMKGDKCKLIGAAYVGGIMNGEMVDELYCEDLIDSKTLFVV